MPTPSDILKIIKWDPLPKSAESKAFDKQVELQDEAVRQYRDFTPEEKVKFDAEMKDFYESQKPEEKRREAGTPDYSHWNTLSADQKQEVILDLPNAMKRLRASEQA